MKEKSVKFTQANGSDSGPERCIFRVRKMAAAAVKDGTISTKAMLRMDSSTMYFAVQYSSVDAFEKAKKKSRINKEEM